MVQEEGENVKDRRKESEISALNGHSQWAIHSSGHALTRADKAIA